MVKLAITDVIITIQEEAGLCSIFIRDEILQGVGIETQADIMKRVQDEPAGILLYSRKKMEEWIEKYEQAKGG